MAADHSLKSRTTNDTGSWAKKGEQGESCDDRQHRPPGRYASANTSTKGVADYNDGTYVFLASDPNP